MYETVRATFVYYSAARFGMAQNTFSTDVLFPMKQLPKKLRSGVNSVVIMGDLDATGKFIPLSVEQYSGYTAERGLYSEVEHIPLPLTRKDPYRQKLLQRLLYDLNDFKLLKAALSA